MPTREDGTLAGTVLTMIEAVRNLHALGVSLRGRGRRGDEVPARFLGRADLGVLEPGAPADVVVLDDRLEIAGVLCAGRSVSWLETELREQPEALARLLERAGGRARAAARRLSPPRLRYLLIASRGSSVERRALRAVPARTRASRAGDVRHPSLYTIYEQPPRSTAHSWSGSRSPARRPTSSRCSPRPGDQGRPTLALTNDVDSPLARTADAGCRSRPGTSTRSRRRRPTSTRSARSRSSSRVGDDATAREELPGCRRRSRRRSTL